MNYVCEICGKTCGSLLGTKIADGYICFDCNEKLEKMIGNHNPEKLDAAAYKEILLHPAEADKFRENKKKNHSKPLCVVCGTDDLFHEFTTSDKKYVCDKCASNCNMLFGGLLNNEKDFISSHDSAYFVEGLAECYNPDEHIAFDFKSKKLFLKDAMRKKNYKVVDFSDIVNVTVSKEKTAFTGGVETRFLTANIRYHGATISWIKDDSINKHYEFDKVLDCFSRISNDNGPVLLRSDNVQSVQQSSDIPQLKCPKCGAANCTPITETTTSGKDFSAGKGCCGFALLGPLGILCGACGQGKQTSSVTYWMCNNCGNKFQK